MTDFRVQNAKSFHISQSCSSCHLIMMADYYHHRVISPFITSHRIAFPVQVELLLLQVAFWSWTRLILSCSFTVEMICETTAPSCKIFFDDESEHWLLVLSRASRPLLGDAYLLLLSPVRKHLNLILFCFLWFEIRFGTKSYRKRQKRFLVNWVNYCFVDSPQCSTTRCLFQFGEETFTAMDHKIISLWNGLLQLLFHIKMHINSSSSAFPPTKTLRTESNDQLHKFHSLSLYI